MNGQTPQGYVTTPEMNPQELSKTKILLIDELDYLITKDQSVLFNLFEWPQRKKANLIVLSVANTLDLPETFMARISSRIGNTRLVFSPYTSREIKEIISERVARTGIFDPTAIDFISKKVALVSSDIRKTLNICRQTVEKHRSSHAKAEGAAFEEVQKIQMSLVAEVFDNYYSSSPLIEFVKRANSLLVVFLTEMYLEMKLTATKTALFSKVYERFMCSSARSEFGMIKPHEFMQLGRLLAEKHIIQMKKGSSSEMMELHLLTNLDEIHYALKNKKYFSSKYVPL
jgi:Cdc6-like AAA superfamily ATPase